MLRIHDYKINSVPNHFILPFTWSHLKQVNKTNYSHFSIILTHSQSLVTFCNIGQRRIQLEADCVLQELQLGIGQLFTESKLFHNNFAPFWPEFPCLYKWKISTNKERLPKNGSSSSLLTIRETYNQFQKVIDVEFLSIIPLYHSVSK